MKLGTWFAKYSILIVFLVTLAVPCVSLAQPNITALSFTPTSINTSTSPANVTVNFTLNDVGSGVSSISLGFVDPSNSIVQQGFKSFPPATPVTDSLVIAFPQFSPAGTWKVLYVFLSDAAGNTLYLDGAGVAAAGFQTDLTVSSAVDSLPPTISSLSYAGAINTTSADVNLAVNFSVADDLSGVVSVYAGFTSPSGQTLRGNRTTFAPATSVTNSVPITFPKLSEPGAWTLTTVIVTDAANNTLILDSNAAAARSFPTTLSVTSDTDTTAPVLTSPISFSPSTITTNGSPVVVTYAATDNLSGVSRIDVTFVSPSGTQTVNGGATFTPTTSASGTIPLTFPNPSELGTWTLASIFLSDAAGNTSIINQSISLPVTVPGADVTPPVIIPTVSPLPNGGGWNNTTPVTVTWNVTDAESAITSTTGCGTTTLTSPTTGTTVTCSATSSGGTSSASVFVKIDIAPPVTSNVLATPDPVIVNTDVTITATVTDTGGSNVASAEFQVDGGPFDDLAALPPTTFGMSTVNVSLLLPGSATPLLQTPGVHNICVRGTDFADNAGATQCVLFAVYDPNGGFATGGGGANSPVGADLANPSGSGPVTFAFNPKYLPNNPTVPSGDLSFNYSAGNIVFKATGWDFLVVTNGNHGQAQGTGTINGSTVCKFSLDAWNSSFQPGNVDAFGLTIFDCAGPGSGNRYNLPAAPITKGSIKVHQ